MNKKSNLTRTALLAALLCGIAGPTFVGCKDYDDDINALQEQIDANKDAIAKLQELVNGGAIVKSVVSDNNGGIIITLSDGTEHHITKGDKGEQGEQGLQGEQGIQGLPGAEGKTPIFWFNEENGHLLYAYDSNTPKEEWKDLGKITADVEEPTEPQKPSYEFTVNEDGFLCVDGVATSVRIEGRMYLVEEEGVIWLHMPKMVDGKLDYSYKIALPTSELFLHTVSSLNFVPFTKDGEDLKIYGLQVKDVKDKFVNATPSQLRFRVNPSTVIYGKDFTVLEGMDYFQTRANNEKPLFTATYNKEASEAEKGMIYVDFGYNSDLLEIVDENATEDKVKTYTLALGVQDLHNKDRQVYSDYIKFTNVREELTPALDLGEKGIVELVRQENSSVNLLEKVIAVAGEKDMALKDYKALKDYGFDVTYNYTVLTKVPGENVPESVQEAYKKYQTYFKLDASSNVVTLTDATFQAKDAYLLLQVDVMANGERVDQRNVKVQVVAEIVDPEEQVFNIIENVKTTDYIGERLVMWIPFMEGGKNKLETFFNDDIDSYILDAVVKDANGKESYVVSCGGWNFVQGKLQIDVKQAIGNEKLTGIYNVEVTIYKDEQSTKKAVIPFTVEIADYVLEKVNGFWDGDKLLALGSIKDGKFDLSLDLSSVFVVPANTKLTFTKDGKEIENISLNEEEAEKLALGETVDVTIGYKLVNDNNTDYVVVEENNCIVRFYNPIRKLEMTDKEISLKDVSGTSLNLLATKITEGGKEKIVSGALALNLLGDNRSGELKYLLKDGQNASFYGDAAKGMEAADAYGVTGVEFSLVNKSDDDVCDLTTDGKFTWLGTSASLPNDYPVEVKVSIKNNWQTIERVIKIVVKPNL